MLKWIKRLFRKHEYCYIGMTSPLPKKWYKAYICRKCGKKIMARVASEYEDWEHGPLRGCPGEIKK